MIFTQEDEVSEWITVCQHCVFDWSLRPQGGTVERRPSRRHLLFGNVKGGKAR